MSGTQLTTQRVHSGQNEGRIPQVPIPSTYRYCITTYRLDRVGDPGMVPRFFCRCCCVSLQGVQNFNTDLKTYTSLVWGTCRRRPRLSYNFSTYKRILPVLSIGGTVTLVTGHRLGKIIRRKEGKLKRLGPNLNRNGIEDFYTSFR